MRQGGVILNKPTSLKIANGVALALVSKGLITPDQVNDVCDVIETVLDRTAGRTGKKKSKPSQHPNYRRMG